MWIKDGVHFKFNSGQFSGLPTQLPTELPIISVYAVLGSLICIAKFPWTAHGQPTPLPTQLPTFSPAFAKRGDIKSHSSVRLSVRPSVRPSVCHKNFNLAHIFWSIKDRALIFGMHDPCDMPFQVTPCRDLDLWPSWRSKLLPSGGPQFSEFACSYLEVVGCLLGCPLSCPLFPYMEVVSSLICMAKFPWVGHGQPTPLPTCSPRAARWAAPLFFPYGL